MLCGMCARIQMGMHLPALGVSLFLTCGFGVWAGMDSMAYCCWLHGQMQLSTCVAFAAAIS